jgi:uncharacterized protein YuzE
MNLTYDHTVDAMYIKLTDNLPISTKSVNESVVIDLDENDEVVGIEILNVRTSGIDPLSVAMTYYTKDHQAKPPDPQEVKARQIAIAEARKRKKQKTIHQSG